MLVTLALVQFVFFLTFSNTSTANVNSTQQAVDSGNEEPGEPEQTEELNLPLPGMTYVPPNAEDVEALPNTYMAKPDWLATYHAFRSIVRRGIALAGKTGMATKFGIFTAVLGEVFREKNQATIWDQISHRLQSKLGREFLKDKLDSMQSLWREFFFIATKPNMTCDDLAFFLSQQPNFFPQDHSTTSVSASYVGVVKAYLQYVVAGYLNLMQQGKVKKCALARELTKLRPEIIEVCKALYQKRYREIDGHGVIEKFLRKRLVFVDNLDGHRCEDTISETKEKCFGGRIQENMNPLLQYIIDDFNAFSATDIAQDGCSVPNPITIEECTFKYDTECYGTYHGQHCQMPCFKYGKNYNWCLSTSTNIATWAGDYEYCEPADLLECMKLQRTRPSVFECNEIPIEGVEKRNNVQKKVFLKKS